ncbi:MAG: hypothetical protein ACLU9S_15050 [Oscillospiraceae bacterium]
MPARWRLSTAPGKLPGTRASSEEIHDCLAATKVAGRGPLICKFGCLGFGNCTKACQFDAIHLENGVAKVDPDKCTGCMSLRRRLPPAYHRPGPLRHAHHRRLLLHRPGLRHPPGL